MRFSSGFERALVASRRFQWQLKVEMQGVDGVYRTLSSLAGRNWVNSMRWRWNLDQPVMSGQLELHRSVGGASLSPFITGSSLNLTGAGGSAGPQVDVRRKIRISTATLPPGAYSPLTHRNLFTWSADQRDASWSQSLAGMAVMNIPGIDGVANTGITLTDSQATAFNAVSKSVAIPNDSNPVYAHFYVVKDAVTTRFPQLALVISGGTTTGQRRSSFNTQTGADVIANTTGSGVSGSTTVIDEGSRWHVIVMVPNNSTGNTSATMTIYPAARTVQAGADNVAATGSIGLLNTMLESTANPPAWAPIVTQAAAVTVDDWKEVFQGYTDKYDVGGADPTIVIPFRDLGAVLQQTIVETERVYGSVGGVDGATVMQSILTDNASLIGSSITLVVPVAITLAVRTFKLAIGTSIMDALNAIARKAGAVVRYKYDANGVPQLTFYRPDRSKVTPDYIFATSEYLSFDSLDADIAGLRNVVGVPFTDSGPGGTGNRLVAWSIASTANLLQYGRQAMILGQDVTSQINTLTEAQALADNALADTAYPYSTGKATHDFTWWAEGGDLLRYAPDGKHADTNLDLAAMDIEHVFQASQQGVTARTTITGRPNVAALYRTWLRFQDTDPTTSLLPSIIVTDTPGATPANDHTITYNGIYDLLEMSQNGGPWGTPSASPFTITPNGVGGAAKVLVFRATKAGVQTTATVTVQPAGAAAALPPFVEVMQFGTPTLASEQVQIVGLLGAYGTGPITWRWRQVNSLTGAGTWSAWNPNSGATLLPFVTTITRALKWKIRVEAEVQDAAGLLGTESYDVASRMDALDDNGVINDSTNMSSGVRPFRRTIDTTSEIVSLTGRGFIDQAGLDGSLRPTSVFRGAAYEPVGNLFKRGTDSASDVVEVAGRWFTNNGMLDASRNIVSVLRSGLTEPVGNLFKRGSDSATDVVTTSSRTFVDPGAAVQVDASGRIVGVYRLGIYEPVNNLVKIGDAISGSVPDSSLSSNIPRLNGGQSGVQFRSVTNSATETGTAMTIREYNVGGVMTGVTSESPRINFYWSGRVSRQWGMDALGHFHNWDAAGTSHGSIYAASFIMQGGNANGDYIDTSVANFGSFRAVGSYGGYSGIEFISAGANFMMSNGTTQYWGIWASGIADWLWLFDDAQYFAGVSSISTHQQFLGVRQTPTFAAGGIIFANNANVVKGRIHWDSVGFGLLDENANWILQRQLGVSLIRIMNGDMEFYDGSTGHWKVASVIVNSGVWSQGSGPTPRDGTIILEY